jgi:hypothetical protein
MDLSKVEEKIGKSEYVNYNEMREDLDLIWSNCYDYNHEPVCRIVIYIYIYIFK